MTCLQTMYNKKNHLFVFRLGCIPRVLAPLKCMIRRCGIRHIVCMHASFVASIVPSTIL